MKHPHLYFPIVNVAWFPTKITCSTTCTKYNPTPIPLVILYLLFAVLESFKGASQFANSEFATTVSFGQILMQIWCSSVSNEKCTKFHQDLTKTQCLTNTKLRGSLKALSKS